MGEYQTQSTNNHQGDVLNRICVLIWLLLPLPIFSQSAEEQFVAALKHSLETDPAWDTRRINPYSNNLDQELYQLKKDLHVRIPMNQTYSFYVTINNSYIDLTHRKSEIEKSMLAAMYWASYPFKKQLQHRAYQHRELFLKDITEKLSR